MKIVKLKDAEVKVLNNDCQSDILKKYLANGYFDSKSSSLVLMLNEEDLRVIDDELIALITEKGTDQDGEINSFGKILDHLIDKFNHYD